MGYENNPAVGSSEEFWAMCASMTQRISGDDEDYGSCKVYSCVVEIYLTLAQKEAMANTCASSRGNT